jgi:hypothetical protein
MAVQALPTITTIISGDNVTAFNKNIQFTLAEKLENVLYLKSSDGNVEIDYSKINNIQSILFYSTSTFTINISIDIGTVETPNIVIVPIETTGNFRLDPTTALIGKISSITISTASTTDITIYVNVYGKVVTA